jgi:hypothetical protein
VGSFFVRSLATTIPKINGICVPNESGAQHSAHEAGDQLVDLYPG